MEMLCFKTSRSSKTYLGLHVKVCASDMQFLWLVLLLKCEKLLKPLGTLGYLLKQYLSLISGSANIVQSLSYVFANLEMLKGYFLTFTLPIKKRKFLRLLLLSNAHLSPLTLWGIIIV